MDVDDFAPLGVGVGDQGRVGVVLGAGRLVAVDLIAGLDRRDRPQQPDDLGRAPLARAVVHDGDRRRIERTSVGWFELLSPWWVT